MKVKAFSSCCDLASSLLCPCLWLASRRMCPVWLLVAVVVVGVARGAVSQCWEHPSCQELNSESSMMVTHYLQIHYYSLLMIRIICLYWCFCVFLLVYFSFRRYMHTYTVYLINVNIWVLKKMFSPCLLIKLYYTLTQKHLCHNLHVMRKKHPEKICKPYRTANRARLIC